VIDSGIFRNIEKELITS